MSVLGRVEVFQKSLFFCKSRKVWTKNKFSSSIVNIGYVAEQTLQIVTINRPQKMIKLAKITIGVPSFIIVIGRSQREKIMQ